MRPSPFGTKIASQPKPLLPRGRSDNRPSTAPSTTSLPRSEQMPSAHTARTRRSAKPSAARQIDSRPPSFSQYLMNGPGKPPKPSSSTPASSTITGRFSRWYAACALPRATAPTLSACSSSSSSSTRSMAYPRMRCASSHLLLLDVTKTQPLDILAANLAWNAVA